jgi:hypothetical protein
MRKLLLFLLLPLFLTASVVGDIVGSDSFEYANGPLAGNNGGYGWDYQGEGNPQGTSPTSWVHYAGTTDVTGEVLVLQDSGDGWIAAKREFSSDTWGTGAFQNTGIVYFAATLIIDETQGWLGISAQDGDSERVKFGMPWTGGGMGYLGVNQENSGVYVLSDVMATLGVPYRIVGVLDYDNNAARMWIDPDSGDYDTAWDHTSADVVFNSLDMWNWVNGVRIGSGAGTTWDDVIIATTFSETFIPGSLADRPHDPDPGPGDVDVLITSSFSWTVPQDPNGLVDPNLVSMKLYMATSDDPNFVFASDINSWDAGTLQASYTPSGPFALQRDKMYYWRVDSIKDTTETLEGDIWSFYTELSIPIITEGPDYQVVIAGTTANFTVVVDSLSPETYQWYKYVDGVSDTPLSDAGDISGSQASTLSIANVEIADEGAYYCIVNNDSGIEAISENALLGVKRRIAYWDFESGNANSTVAGSPVSLLYNDPNFVTTGIVGDGMEFDNDFEAEDMLYTDPDQVSYFDICNYTMTVSCWIKSTAAATWSPMVARNGEDGQGWQLRHHGNTLDRICFTTRGTGNEDGTASNRTVYDGGWHYAVGTYDGTVKKVYIDGVLSRVYSADDGTLDFDSDAVSGLIAPTGSPVALAGRIKGDVGNGLVFENWTVTACILDEVSIYNYAQDAGTIAQTYADISGNNVCPDPANPMYDLTDDCIVDLDDFLLIASEWLIDTSVKP